MDQFDDWHHRIGEGKIDNALKSEIADEILRLLEEKKGSLSEWEKLHFAKAITALSVNVNSMYQPTEAGLAICLTALQQAIIEGTEPNDLYAKTDSRRDLFSYASLVATVENIKAQIS